MVWAQAATIIAALSALIGLQIWIARAVDALRDAMHREFDRVETRLHRLEGGEPPTLRRV